MASIKKRGDRTWRARYRDEAGREHSRHFQRRVDAQRWVDEVTTSIVSGNYVDPKAGKMTFRAYFDQWSARQVWVTGTVQSMNLAVDSTTFTDKPVRTIRRSHLEAWVKQMIADGLSPGTVGTRFRNIRTVFRAAKKDRVIANDPSEGIALPRQRRPEHAMTIPTPEQVGQIIAAAEVWFQPFIAMCAFAGLRLGEAAAVKIDDIDFLRRAMTVSRQVQRRAGHEPDIRAPKYNSERVVYLPDDLVTMLSEYVRNVGVRPEGWLFVGMDGAPPHSNTIGRWWRKALKDAGLPPPPADKTRKRQASAAFHLHDLRHFYASGLIAQGCDVVTVQRALGHSSATTTLNVYSHLWPTAEDRTRKAAAAMMKHTAGNLADSVRTEGN
ncbi:MAG: tyrosine-type recombinase/integrase [Candidatus Sericytochromatia bacterium]